MSILSVVTLAIYLLQELLGDRRITIKILLNTWSELGTHTHAWVFSVTTQLKAVVFGMFPSI